MKKRAVRIWVILAVLLSMANTAWAESISLTMSITIPAIPGVNAPPFPKDKASQDKTASAQEAAKPQTQTSQNNAPATIQEEAVKEARVVRTFYSR